jgi:hypothetical protein
VPPELEPPPELEAPPPELEEVDASPPPSAAPCPPEVEDEQPPAAAIATPLRTSAKKGSLEGAMGLLLQGIVNALDLWDDGEALRVDSYRQML